MLPAVFLPLQYLGERAVFARGRYNAMLTAAELVSLDLLHRYWGDRYAAGEACGVLLQAASWATRPCIAPGAARSPLPGLLG